MGHTERTDPFLTADDWGVLVDVCRGVGIDPEIVEQMIAAENRVYGMGRRHGILESLENLISAADGVRGTRKDGSK